LSPDERDNAEQSRRKQGQRRRFWHDTYQPERFLVATVIKSADLQCARVPRAVKRA